MNRRRQSKEKRLIQTHSNSRDGGRDIESKAAHPLLPFNAFHPQVEPKVAKFRAEIKRSGRNPP